VAVSAALAGCAATGVRTTGPPTQADRRNLPREAPGRRRQGGCLLAGHRLARAARDRGPRLLAESPPHVRMGRHLAQEGFVAQCRICRHGRITFATAASSPSCRHIYLRASPGGRASIRRASASSGSPPAVCRASCRADSPSLAIWIGLDPVDRDGIGAKAAPRIRSRTVVLTAEPSSCNAHGNARGIVAALPRPEHFSVPGAVHVDAEWPTGWMAETPLRSLHGGQPRGVPPTRDRGPSEALATP